MKEKKQSEDKFVWLIVRLILLAIAVSFTIFAFSHQPCDVDNVFLSCRLTGTAADWIGSIMFIGGLVWMSGIIKGVRNLVSPPGSTSGNYIVFAIVVLGAILFWNL